MKENSAPNLVDPVSRKSGQMNFIYNQLNDLNIPSYRSNQTLKANTNIGVDADKINAAELMSVANTLTNPYNKKQKIDL